MMMSGNGEISVPPGFRFHPTDEELLYYYLRKKVSDDPIDMDIIREVDLNKFEPWDLKDKCRIGSGPQNEWYLFSHKDKKYPTGTRTNRATTAGFWKATGRDKAIFMSSSLSKTKRIGMRKTLVFYTGRAPHGHKTDWIMHEYRLELYDHTAHIQEDGWVVCRVFKKKTHTRGFHSEIDQDQDQRPIVNLPLINSNCLGQLEAEPKLNSAADQTQYGGFGFDHNSNAYMMHMPQLMSPESIVPSSIFSTLPLTAMDVLNCSQNLLKINHSGEVTPPPSIPPAKFSGDWSFLDKLLATHPKVDQMSKCQIQLPQQVADLVPAAARRFPFCNGFEPDFSKYSG